MKIAILHLQNITPLFISEAVTRAGMSAVSVSENDRLPLTDFAGYILADNMKIGDAAFMQFLKEEAKRGKPVLALGIAARVVLENGLIPGVENDKAVVLLSEETSAETTIQLTDEYQYNAFTRRLMPETLFSVARDQPARHFMMPPALLMEIKIQGLNIFCYQSTAESNHERIAALSNKAGNVMALLPALTSPDDWDKLFQSMRETILENHFIEVPPLYYYPRTI